MLLLLIQGCLLHPAGGDARSLLGIEDTEESGFDLLMLLSLPGSGSSGIITAPATEIIMYNDVSTSAAFWVSAGEPVFGACAETHYLLCVAW